jgi:transcription elongation factor GreA-like protein
MDIVNTTPVVATNAGNMWTPIEEEQLLKALAADVKVSKIANDFGRTVGAIVARQNHIARNLVNKEGKTIEEAASIVKRTPREIEQSLSKSKKEPLKQVVQQKPKDENSLTVLIEIRELLKQMVANQQRILESVE